jgi:ketosteroid isomerase-like protein
VARATGPKETAGIHGDERLLTEDFKWILANRTVWTIAKIKAHCERRRTEVMPELPTMTVTTSTAEGDQVALEFAGKCALANGKRYDNFYHFLVLFRNGRICSIREYVDTKLVFDVFGYGRLIIDDRARLHPLAARHSQL